MNQLYGNRRKIKLVRERTQNTKLLRFSQTCELWSSKAAFTIAFFTDVNHNYDHKQRTLKHRNTQNGSNPPITNHKPWPFEPVKVKFCFLRGPLRWLTAAKNAIVSWLLNFRIRMFVKSALKRASIKPRTRNIPEHPGTWENKNNFHEKKKIK